VSRTGGVSLAYDPNGRLWQLSAPTGTTRFVYDGDKLLEEYDGGGNWLRAYGHGPGADEPLLWWEGTAGWARRSLHADHQGSIVAVADDNSGSAVAVNGYDAWGIPNAGNGGRFQYTGQAWLGELGLYYYKARLYSPTLGRFLQVDPVGYKDQVNLYAYVDNDPVDHTDPKGLCVDNTCPVSAFWGSTDYYLKVRHTEEEAGAIGVPILAAAVLSPVIYEALAFSGRFAISNAYREAAAGGRHGGFLRQVLQRSESQVRSTIRSLEARANQHVGYLKDPAKAVAEKGGNWSKMSQQAKDGLIRHWSNELKTFKEEARIAKDALKLRF
jgi:RHS repeat-associated protein